VHEPLPPIETVDEEEYELEQIPLSEYRYGTLCYCMKYKEYSAEQSKWLLAEYLEHAQDMVRKYYALDPN
jgi:hypothetical protein